MILRLLLLAVISIAGTGWYMTRPEALPPDWGANLTPDPDAGALVFAAGGCASCHVAPESQPSVQPLLSGGKAFVTEFGTFYASNISPHPVEGIGSWSLAQFATALTQGASPTGEHYYPAFPYSSYRLMKPQDIANLFAHLRSLPESDAATRSHAVAFPFSLRRGVGIWKAIYMPEGFTVGGDLSPTEDRGRYLAEALGHCAECHTPRTALGGLDRSQWMEGAADPSGKGRIPGITRKHLDWSQADLEAYFETGFTPEYDTAGGDMADVVRNLAQLPAADRQALAAYVVGLN